MGQETLIVAYTRVKKEESSSGFDLVRFRRANEQLFVRLERLRSLLLLLVRASKFLENLRIRPSCLALVLLWWGEFDTKYWTMDYS